MHKDLSGAGAYVVTTFTKIGVQMLHVLGAIWVIFGLYFAYTMGLIAALFTPGDLIGFLTILFQIIIVIIAWPGFMFGWFNFG